MFKYSGADAYGRYQRMRGKAVFQPMGFDAFGIHTENFALRTGQHPHDRTGRKVENFRAPLEQKGDTVCRSLPVRPLRDKGCLDHCGHWQERRQLRVVQ